VNVFGVVVGLYVKAVNALVAGRSLVAYVAAAMVDAVTVVMNGQYSEVVKVEIAIISDTVVCEE
jgi:hypothetical protein